MHEIDARSVAGWSKSYRQLAGLTQRQLAAHLGTTRGVIGALERGVIRSRRVALAVLDLTTESVDGLI